MNIVVSQCLLGVPCRYDGKSCPNQKVTELQGYHKLIAVCPEAMAGLPIPREPMELNENRRAVSKKGVDFTDRLVEQGNAIVSLMEKNNCKKAILKSKSPSCGVGKIYDGSFSKTLVDGDGIVAEIIKKAGFQVVTEDEIQTLFE